MRNDITAAAATCLSGKLRRCDSQSHHRAAALDLHRDRSPDDLTDHQSLEIADALDRSSIELDDEVASSNAAGCRRTAIEQLDDLEATSPD